MKKIIYIFLLIYIIFFMSIISNISYAEQEINVDYVYDQNTNQVTVYIKSDIELQDTKPTWKLSEDKHIYTKVFSENTIYTTPVVDIYGREIIVNINVNQILPRKANIKIEYNYNNDTNQVIAYIKSDIELQDTKPTWELSEDKKTYKKIFNENTIYQTPVEDIYGNIKIVDISITEIKEFNIDINYEYNKTIGQVIVTITSSNILRDTKPTWTLSEDGFIYTKIFTENTTYSTPVVDIFGKEIMVNININQIGTDKATIKTEYTYNKETNQVIAKIISDIQLKDTKPTWKLSEDKLIYMKVFEENTEYTTPIEDIYGNIINVKIEIKDIDDIPPKITLEYIYNDNDTVTVYIKANEQLKDTKPTWKLSEDGYVYEKTFETDQNYSTLVEDLCGVQTSVKIEFKTRKYTYSIKEDNSTIIVKYLYTDQKQVLIEIISSVKMQDTKPTWKLSEDGYRYTKIFNENNIYETPIVDINGLTKNVNIIINLFDNYLLGIDVSAHQKEINWSEVKNFGIDFAIIRCGYGQDFDYQDDAYFLRNVSECERLGIPYGVYLYSYALNVENALSEADHVLRLIQGINPELGIWLDLEDDNYKISNGMPTNETFVDIAIAFCEKIKENGYNKVGIYANLEWWNKRINDSRLDVYEKWVAQWGEKCDYDKKYVMWQYTSNGKVNGITGNVDMNIYYK